MQFSISLSQPMGETHLRCNAKVLFDVSHQKKKKSIFIRFWENTTSDPQIYSLEQTLFFYRLRSLTLQLFIPSELYFTWRNILFFLLTQIMLL